MEGRKTQKRMAENSRSTSVDNYIARFPANARKKLTQIRKLVKQIAPAAEERISYRMPAFFLNGVLLWYAAYSKHIGFYPMGSGVAKFERELKTYKHAKGSIQFPIDEPLPLELIKRIVKFRVKENLNR